MLKDKEEVLDMDFRSFLLEIHLSQSACARRFSIPLRTVQDWAGNRRTAPPYVRLMMAEIMGLYHPDDNIM